jgi:hypothetical protein
MHPTVKVKGIATIYRLEATTSNELHRRLLMLGEIHSRDYRPMSRGSLQMSTGIYLKDGSSVGIQSEYIYKFDDQC